MLHADPKLTGLQILFLQATYYLLLGICLIIFSFFFASASSNLSTAHLFPTFSCLFTFDTGLRHMSIVILLSHVAVIPLMVQVLASTVDHASKVLDFVATLYLVHMLLSIVFTHKFPTGVLWWGTIIIEAIVVTTVGELVCARRDRRSLAAITTRMERDRTGGSSGSGSGGGGSRAGGPGTVSNAVEDSERGSLVIAATNTAERRSAKSDEIV